MGFLKVLRDRLVWKFWPSRYNLERDVTESFRAGRDPAPQCVVTSSHVEALRVALRAAAADMEADGKAKNAPSRFIREAAERIALHLQQGDAWLPRFGFSLSPSQPGLSSTRQARGAQGRPKPVELPDVPPPASISDLERSHGVAYPALIPGGGFDVRGHAIPRQDLVPGAITSGLVPNAITAGFITAFPFTADGGFDDAASAFVDVASPTCDDELREAGADAAGDGEPVRDGVGSVGESLE